MANPGSKYADRICEGHLEYCTTDQQRMLVELASQGIGVNEIARRTGLHNTNISRSLKDTVARAEQAGFAPDLDLDVPLPGDLKLHRLTMYQDTDEAGNWTTKRRYVIGQRINTKDDLSRVVEAIDNAVANIKPCKPIPSPRKVHTELCNLLHITDYHLAAYASAAVGDGEWNMEIAEREFIRAVTSLIDQSPEAGVGIFSQGGDFLHYDSLKAETPGHKHLLDVSGYPGQMVEFALNMHIFAIEYMLKHHRQVVAIVQEGNHDEYSSIWLRKCLKQHFAKNKRVKILDTEFPYYAYLHGEIMLGFHHGHKKKNKELPALFASEPRYREMWGRAKYTYIHTGHHHQREQDMSEHGGAIVERHPTLAARDAYAARGGWVSWRAVNCITYHKSDGEISRRTEIPRES